MDKRRLQELAGVEIDADQQQLDEANFPGKAEYEQIVQQFGNQLADLVNKQAQGDKSKMLQLFRTYAKKTVFHLTQTVKAAASK